MPAGVPYIVSNEFAERFCFYGINSILTIYLVQFLHFTDAKGASWQSLFKSGAYFFPMIGAIVSDVFWGKFTTIMTFSIIYCAGCVSLAFFSERPPASARPLDRGVRHRRIKPCVSTNVGDQFTSKNQHLIERAFSWFYSGDQRRARRFSIWFCPILLTRRYGPKLGLRHAGGDDVRGHAGVLDGPQEIRGRPSGRERPGSRTCSAPRAGSSSEPDRASTSSSRASGCCGTSQRQHVDPPGAILSDGTRTWASASRSCRRRSRSSTACSSSR
jgi:hypothetical protein